MCAKMKAFDFTIPGISVFRSWQWHHPDFLIQWQCFCNENYQKDKQIWCTRLKDVKLLSVPTARGDCRVAFKCYREKRLLRYFLRPSLAAREAAGFKIVESLHIPVAQVLAVGEKRRFFNLVEAYIVTRFEENTESLLYFADHPEEWDMLLALLKENIARLGRLHAAGYTHGGAHPRNFLWRKNASGQLESLWIDLATVRQMISGKKGWKYLLTDLADLVENFRLSQNELDDLIAEYRKYNDIPVAYRERTDHEYKFSTVIHVG